MTGIYQKVPGEGDNPAFLLPSPTLRTENLRSFLSL